MIPKSGNRFSEKIMLKMEVLSQHWEKTMIHDAPSLRLTLGFAVFGFSLAALAPVQAQAPSTTPNAHMEIIHHPNYDKTVNMPFPPALKITSGKPLWPGG